MKPIISSTLIRGLNKGCISNENVSVIEEYFDNNGSIIDKDGAPKKQRWVFTHLCFFIQLQMRNSNYD